MLNNIFPNQNYKSSFEMKNRTVPFFSERKWDVSLFNLKPYNIRVSEAECEISLVAHYFRSSNGFTPQKRLFLAKFSPL